MGGIYQAGRIDHNKLDDIICPCPFGQISDELKSYLYYLKSCWARLYFTRMQCEQIMPVITLENPRK